MDWAAVQTGLISAIQEASGNPSLDVTWRDRTNEWHSAPWEGGSKVEIHLSNMGQIHEDFVTYQEEAGQLRPTVYGARLPVFRFSIETADQDLADSSWALADRIKTALRLPSAHGILEACGLAISAMSPTQAVPMVEDGRTLSFVVWDITFNASSSFQGALVDYFQSVAYTVQVKDQTDNVVLEEDLSTTLP